MEPSIKTTHDQFMENTLNENIKLNNENKEIKQDTINLSYLIDELSDSANNIIKYGRQYEAYGNRMGRVARFSISLNLILAVTVVLNFIWKYS